MQLQRNGSPCLLYTSGAELVSHKRGASCKDNFIATRKGIPCVASASPEELKELLAEDPAYGNVICRCDTVTAGEIITAIRRPVGSRSLDGVKRRTRAGMGRCQAGFCSPRVMEILERELSMNGRNRIRQHEVFQFIVQETIRDAAK